MAGRRVSIREPGVWGGLPASLERDEEGQRSVPLDGASRVRSPSPIRRECKSWPLRPVRGDHGSLLSRDECICALLGGHLDRSWLLSGSEEERRPPPPLRSGLLGRCAVCAVLILVSANDALLKAASQQRGRALLGERYSPSSVMLVSNAISVVVGNALCVMRAGPTQDADGQGLQGLRSFWRASQLLEMSVPAVFFTLSGTLKFMALGLVPPDVVVTMEQSTMLLCALMGWACLGKRYSALQVAALLATSGGVLSYQQAERRAVGGGCGSFEGDSEPLLPHYWTGIALMCGSVVMVTAGGLSCEKLLKSAADRPFYVQKAQMELSMAAAGLLYCLAVQPLLQGSSPLLDAGLFHGWDGWTALVLVLHTAKSWLATTTVRVLDSLTFALAGNAAMVLVYFERLLLLSDSSWGAFRPDAFAALCCVALGAGGFAAASRRRPGGQSVPPSSGQPSARRAVTGGIKLLMQRRRLVPLDRPLAAQDPEPPTP